ncbi:hypothetical protein N4627_05590 [Limosilactobacillus vaginalis]|uniref:hypothetical protein n=1 Tax=Limosilactobacillus vaginalis TaxID=1633 RepID=UPI0021B644C4|nr:hypothetical protein [Limosilactobacillus vaginalis]UXC68571.1 hypothetical protein N4627_05590 [Limosilactobacillus vaginalis]
MELHTDDFPLLLNRDFYKDLIENFKLIEHECSQLESDLSNETSARINADNNERSERINQDVNLQNQINTLSGRMDKAESNISNLQTRMSTAEEQIKKLNEVIFGTEYINDTDELALGDSTTPEPDVEVNETNVVDNNQAEIDTSRDDYVTANEEIN